MKIYISISLYTECPKIYRKSVLPLPTYIFELYFSRCSTDLRLNFGKLGKVDKQLKKIYVLNLPLTLVMIRGKYTLVMIGGGSKCPPPLFLFVKTIEKVIRLCTVLKKIEW